MFQSHFKPDCPTGNVTVAKPKILFVRHPNFNSLTMHPKEFNKYTCYALCVYNV